jgi:hypothetical protein
MHGQLKTPLATPKELDIPELNELYGNILVIADGGYNKDRRRMVWGICVADGTLVHKLLSDLKKGRCTNCGCLYRASISKRSGTHRLRDHPLYDIWAAMHQRCTNPNNKDYNRYGGRGITYCPEWESFEEFYSWAINNGWYKGKENHRIDNDKGYNPGNCMWLTNIEHKQAHKH